MAHGECRVTRRTKKGNCAEGWRHAAPRLRVHAPTTHMRGARARLHVTDKDAVADGRQAHDVRRQLAVLTLAQQAALAHVVDAQRAVDAGKQAALERRECARDPAHGRLMHEHEAPAVVAHAVDADEALCAD